MKIFRQYPQSPGWLVFIQSGLVCTTRRRDVPQKHIPSTACCWSNLMKIEYMWKILLCRPAPFSFFPTPAIKSEAPRNMKTKKHFHYKLIFRSMPEHSHESAVSGVECDPRAAVESAEINSLWSFTIIIVASKIKISAASSERNATARATLPSAVEWMRLKAVTATSWIISRSDGD